MHYKKVLPRKLIVGIYILLTLAIIFLTTITFIIKDDFDFRNHGLLYIFLIVTELASPVYSIAQNFRTEKLSNADNILQLDKDIEFVDRDELTNFLLQQIEDGFTSSETWYVKKDLIHSNHNGKTSFAVHLCEQLQDIRTNSKGITKYSAIHKKIGNICMIQDLPRREVEKSIQAQPCIRYKINVFVLVCMYPIDLPTKIFRDPDVFFVVLNFCGSPDITPNLSENALSFPPDKIRILLENLRSNARFSGKLEPFSDEALAQLATKLGELAHNNVGTVISILKSDDFNLLLETDHAFFQFYTLIRQAKYKDAEKQYNQLPLPNASNPIYAFKHKYEHANLEHFLGRYIEAEKELSELLLELLPNTGKSHNLAVLYYDTVMLKSHVLKHQGRFDEAATQLMNFCPRETEKTLRWRKSRFSVDVFRINEQLRNKSPADYLDSTLQYHQILAELEQSMKEFQAVRSRTMPDSTYYYHETFIPIVEFYLSGFDKRMIPKLLEIEDIAIDYYREHELRYVTNCYFIKAELSRLSEDWDNARIYYSYCLDVYAYNGDKDILYLLAITAKNIELYDGKKIFPNLNLDDILNTCKQADGYNFHRRLISQMELGQQNPLKREQEKFWHQRLINPIP